ncbi:hypothetical protein P153DRAFT_368673, partial [Dothidotthia symphoricarpi CBS 119687]
MHCEPHFEILQNSVSRGHFAYSLSTACSPSSLVQPYAMSTPASIDNTTPTSTRRSTASSLFNEFNASSPSSTSSSMSSAPTSRPKRSSMKPNFKPMESVGANLNRRSVPPTVRFLDPEPISRPEARQQLEGFNPMVNPRLTPRHLHIARSMSNPSMGGVIPPARVGSAQQTRQKLDRRLSAPVQHQLLDPRWSSIPPPARSIPPRLSPGARTTSCGSTISNSSIQSAPGALFPPAHSTASGLEAQYNPLRNHIPCLYPGCTTHYSHAQAGPTYYHPQEPYLLSRHQVYCPRHATKDLKDANAICKEEWERMRQSAGRKTLGAISVEFDDFLKHFRDERRGAGRALDDGMKMRVLGPAKSALSPKGKEAEKDPGEWSWDWRYTPRPCTKKDCTAPFYSPFANYIHAFYATRRHSSLLPLQSLCPSCSRAEVEALEKVISDKWGSRSGGWDEEEWHKWFGNTVRERDTKGGFWEKAQEKIVKEKRQGQSVNQKTRKEGDNVVIETGKKEKRKSVFRRMLGSAFERSVRNG